MAHRLLGSRARWQSLLPLLAFGCVTTTTNDTTARNGSTTCPARYEHEAANKGTFAGLGVGITESVASDAALEDLAKQIRVRVESRSETHESATAATFEQSVGTTVSEVLNGATVVKRCVRPDGRHEAVTILPKVSFLRTLAGRLEKLSMESARLTAGFGATTGTAERLSLALRAREFLVRHEKEVDELQGLCKALGGCRTVRSAATVDALGAAVTANAPLFKFSLETKDDEARSVSHDLADLLTADGFLVEASPSRNAAAAACKVRHFPPMEATTYEVAELTCTVTFAVDGATVTTRTYEAKGIGHEKQEALAAARRQLRPTGH